VAFDRRARLGEIPLPHPGGGRGRRRADAAFYSEELAARIPDAKLMVLPTGGHFVPNLVPGVQPGGGRTFLRSHRALG